MVDNKDNDFSTNMSSSSTVPSRGGRPKARTTKKKKSYVSIMKLMQALFILCSVFVIVEYLAEANLEHILVVMKGVDEHHQPAAIGTTTSNPVRRNSNVSSSSLSSHDMIPHDNNKKHGPTLVSACVGVVGANHDPHGIVNFLHYYRKRWGLTHADVYIHYKVFEYVRQVIKTGVQNLDNASTHSNDTTGSIQPPPPLNITYTCATNELMAGDQWNFENGYMIGKCLYDAKRRGSSFHFWFTTSQYLVSKQYRTIQDMFDYASTKGNYSAVAFPLFFGYMQVCDLHKPTFGSATYRHAKPIGSEIADDNNTKLVYTDPPPRGAGARSYIIIPEEFHMVDTMHEPDHDFFPEFDFSGRTIDHQDAKIVDYQGADNVEHPWRENRTVCRFVPSKKKNESCTYVFHGGNDDHVCSDEFIVSHSVIRDVTEVNTILKDVPITLQAADLYREASCYAQRYPMLDKKFCFYNNHDCYAYELFRHYVGPGSGMKMKWGCRDDDGDEQEEVFPQPKPKRKKGNNNKQKGKSKANHARPKESLTRIEKGARTKGDESLDQQKASKQSTNASKEKDS